MPNGVLQKLILLPSTEQKKSLRELNLVTNLLKRSLNVLKPSAIVLKMHLTPCKPSILVSKKSSKGNSKKSNWLINANAIEPFDKAGVRWSERNDAKIVKKADGTTQVYYGGLAKAMV